MAKGKVKWFNHEKGYGFIQPNDGGKDVFVHITEINNSPFTSLQEDQDIEYEVKESRGKNTATNLR